MRNSDKPIDQEVSREAFNLKLDKLSNERQIQEILGRLGERKFGRADLKSCYRQFKDLSQAINNASSKLDQYIRDLGHYKKPEVIEAMSTEAMEQIQEDLWSFTLILRELMAGKEAEGSFLPIQKRDRKPSLN